MSDLLAATGWIGEHPMTGADVAHLLVLCPIGCDAGSRKSHWPDLLCLFATSAVQCLKNSPKNSSEEGCEPAYTCV